MRRYILLILVLAVLGGWLALRLSWGTTFKEGVVGQPVDLIPGQGPANPVDETLEKLLFRSLFRYNEAGEIESDLAKEYRLSADGRTYTIILEEAVWRDGHPITATDVAFTFTRDSAFADITIEQEGEREVRFVLKNPLGSFLDILTRPIAPAHFREISLTNLGSREFFISEVTQEGETVKEITFKTKGSAKIKNLRLKFFKTTDDLIAGARGGEIDGLVADNFSDPSFMLYQTPIYSQYFAVFFNLESSNSLVKNNGFRRAAALKTPLFSEGYPVFGPLSGTWAQGKLSFPTYQKKSAGKFKGSLAITVAKAGFLPQIAQEISRSWKDNLGITVNVNAVSADAVSGILQDRSFEAIILGQEVERDPDRYNLWHSSAKDFPGQNISAYADPRADRSLEEGRKAFSHSSRRKHYLNFQKLFVENNPAIFLFHPKLSYWVNKKFEGPDLGEVFNPEERFWNFPEWQLSFKPGE